MRKILFLDRDGTLICEDPVTERIDHVDKFRLMPGVIPALQAIQHAGYVLVMVTNQEGLGTPEYPLQVFHSLQDLLLDILHREGISFYDIHVDTHTAEDGHPSRKPGTGMLGGYLDGSWDIPGSYVVGDRLTDILLAYNLGCKGILLNHTHPGKTEIQGKDAENLQLALARECKTWEEVAEYILQQAL